MNRQLLCSSPSRFSQGFKLQRFAGWEGGRAKRRPRSSLIDIQVSTYTASMNCFLSIECCLILSGGDASLCPLPDLQIFGAPFASTTRSLSARALVHQCGGPSVRKGKPAHGSRRYAAPMHLAKAVCEWKSCGFVRSQHEAKGRHPFSTGRRPYYCFTLVRVLQRESFPSVGALWKQGLPSHHGRSGIDPSRCPAKI
jgi:hypothetical protein